LYKGLPPVQSHKWRWLIVSAGVVIVGWFEFSYATVPVPAHRVGSGWGGGLVGPDTAIFDRYSLVWIGGAFIIGGVLGVTVARRRWWTTLALYAVGFPMVFALMWFSDSALDYPSAARYGNLFAWFFWIFGVSAGAGVRGLVLRRRVRRASFVSQPG
jgi:hypothetical protein